MFYESLSLGECEVESGGTGVGVVLAEFVGQNDETIVLVVDPDTEHPDCPGSDDGFHKLGRSDRVLAAYTR